MHEVRMPRLTHDMQLGILVDWMVKEGDFVRRGAPLFEVETDKATVGVEAGADGVLAGIRVVPGNEVPIGAMMAYLLAPGEELPAAAAQSAAAQPSVQTTSPSPSPLPRPPMVTILDPRAGGRTISSPIAKRLAAEHGVDLSALRGSGPRGRILERDVLVAVAAASAQPKAEIGIAGVGVEYDIVPLSAIRRRTGERLIASWAVTPQFVLEASVDMTEALRWRERAEGKPSITALLVRVVAAAIRAHPEINVTFVDGELRRYRRVNVGVAVATPVGLMVPVVHDADLLSLQAIVVRLEAIQAAAAEGRFVPADLAGGTLTISNLGPLGIDAFTAVVNPPQAAILAVGQIIPTPVGRNGTIELRPMMCLRLSVDHRALDGALAAPFLSDFRAMLENPRRLL